MILLTGHTGFLGRHLSEALRGSGKEVVGLGRSLESNIRCDLSSSMPDFSVIRQLSEKESAIDTAQSSHTLDLVIHAAGLAHTVPKTEREKNAFFEVNVEGTRNLLDGLKASGTIPKQMLFISTIALYGDPMDELVSLPPYPNRSEAEGLGLSPYAWSKWEAEQLVQDWCEKHGCNGLIWRLPLIVGDNAPGNLGAMETAIKRGYYFRIGDSYRRFRFFVDMSDLQKKVVGLTGQETGTYNVFSGKKSYGEFEDELAVKYGKSIKSIPVALVRFIAKIGDIVPGFPLNTYRLKKLLGE